MIVFDQENRCFSVVEDREFGMAARTGASAAAGAALGSVVPGIGTAIGAAVGGGVGLVSGAGSTIRKAIKDKRRHELSMARLDKGVDRNQLRAKKIDNKHEYAMESMNQGTKRLGMKNDKDLSKLKLKASKDIEKRRLKNADATDKRAKRNELRTPEYYNDRKDRRSKTVVPWAKRA